jgi:hypothetical protein
VFSALSVRLPHNASPLVPSSVKRMGIQRHTALRLSMEESHGILIVDEELEVGL